MPIQDLLNKTELNRQDLIDLLSTVNDQDLEQVRQKAFETLVTHCSDKVFFRGIIEFSNECDRDCFYCGIRKSNQKTRKYTLSMEEILSCAHFAAEMGYGSVVLQSGERSDPAFLDFVENAIQRIKNETRSDKAPEGLRITLGIGEQTPETLKRLYQAGAKRYLLRIETSHPGLFKRLHPKAQPFETRLQCLRNIKSTGYQTGTGVMIGLPGQTIEMLADDLLFFRDENVDMLGMGPYLPHHDTPMAALSEMKTSQDLLRLSFLMIAGARLLLKNVNIAATTALQAIDPQGREKGLQFGANVIMPVLTPKAHRKDYLLYEGKPCLEETALECAGCLERRIDGIGRKIGRNEYGDSKHYV